MIGQFFHFIYVSNIRTILIAMPVLLLIWSLIGMLPQRRMRLIGAIAAVIAVGAILYVTVIARGGSDAGVSPVPFSAFSAARENPELYRSMLMNVFLFMPLGLSLVYVWRGGIPKRLLLTVLTGLLLSLIVETVQYMGSLGFAEADDVICNTLGALLGGCAYPLSRLWKKLFFRKRSL